MLGDRVRHLIYAVGDVHGSYDLVRRAIEKVAAHARGRSYDLIFLGDYIDRGPDSCKTVSLLSSLSSRLSIVCLKGNHEQMLEDFERTRGEEDFLFWFDNGGEETLRSYGVTSLDDNPLIAIPLPHRSWLYGRPIYLESVAHIFVHAGIVPKRLLIDQKRSDLLWIRRRFLEAQPSAFAERRHVVHGHTPIWAGKPEPAVPELLPHRTNLDTGAYDTGVLTVGVFVTGQWGGPVDLLSIT